MPSEIERLTLIRRGERVGSNRPDYRWWQELPADETREHLSAAGYEIVDFIAHSDHLAKLATKDEEVERLKKQARRASERLEGIVTEQINAPLSLADKHRAMFDETGEIALQLREGQVHYDTEWDELEARAEKTEQALAAELKRLTEEFEERAAEEREKRDATQTEANRVAFVARENANLDAASRLRERAAQLRGGSDE